MAMALLASTATPNQRASWLPAVAPAAASGCRAPMMSVAQPHKRRSPHT
jgi:hypothetical protein